MIQLRIVNRDHAGNALSIFEDIPDIAYTFNLSDVSDSSWTIPLSHPSVTRDGFAPKRTDYSIGLSTDYGVTWDEVQDGICGPVKLKTGEDDVKIVGYDYLSYLDQPYPFDYESDPSTLAPTDLVKSWIEQLQIDVIEEIITALNLVSTVDFTVNTSGTWTQIITHVIMYGDSTTVLEMLKSIGALSAPKGFQFTCQPNKQLYFYAPRFTASSTTPIANFAPSFENGLIDIDWGNNGPLATRTVGMYSGVRADYSEYVPSTDEYRAWLEMVDLRENMKSLLEMQAATGSLGALHRNPQKEITIEIQLDRVDPDESYWFYNQCGKTVNVDSEEEFLPYHRIDATYVITKQEIKPNEAGNYVGVLHLDQIYEN